MPLTKKPLSKDLPEYEQVKNLYRTAFPKEERMPWRMIMRMTRRRSLRSAVYYDGKALVGLSLCAVEEEQVFLFYLAVTTEIRNRGYGSMILTSLKEEYAGKVLFLDSERLDPEAPNNEQRIRRMAFYERNGIHQTGAFTHYGGVDYELLATDPDFTKEDFMKFVKEFWVWRRRKR